MQITEIFKTREEKVAEALVQDDKSDQIFIGSPAPKNAMIKAGYFLLGVLFVFLVWFIVSWWYNSFMAAAIFFPTPVEVVNRLFAFFTTNFKIFGQPIWEHLQASLFRWVMGFIVALVIGVFIGLIMSANEKLYQLVSVPVNILQLIPGLAWFPVTILLFGFGQTSAIFIIAVTAISPVAINLANGVRRVPKVNLSVARMSGKSRFETMTDVLIPFATMDILTGTRIAVANGWRMLIAAEMVIGVATGLGFAIQVTSSYLDYVSAFACILIICAIGLFIEKIVFTRIEQYARNKLGVEGSS